MGEGSVSFRKVVLILVVVRRDRAFAEPEPEPEPVVGYGQPEIGLPDCQNPSLHGLT